MTVLDRAFHGLTLRRLAAIALLGLVLSAFDAPTAVTYARGLPAREMLLAWVQTYLGALIWSFAGIGAGVAAYNCTPGGTVTRACAAAAAIGATVWLVLPLAVLVRNAPWRNVLAHQLNLSTLWLSCTALAMLATATLLYMTRNEDVARSLESESKHALDLARAFDEARMQAMQAQIEPHFLFNTLANVRRLYEVDREAARTMLRQFVGMLGETLPDIRTHRSTLAREVALSLAYLNVQKIRMGDRLVFAVDVPESLRDASLPPMILSTLVENAIKHGLAPLPEGGRIVVRAHADAGVLHVEVADTGRGFAESAGSGVGLANIEARLAALFGDAGQLGLMPNEDGGVTAFVELPLTILPAESCVVLA
ncbi:MAG: histidine kinase [Burkholderiales bacterium]